MSAYMSSRRSSNKTLKVVGGLVLMALLIAFDGFAVMTIWNWFVPKIFVGVPSLLLVHAIGLRLVASVLQNANFNLDDDVVYKVFMDIFYTLLLLLFGFIIQGLFF